MKKEYTFVAIVGMFLLSYLLDAVVEPLHLHLATPYQYVGNGYMYQFPFTTASIIIRALAIFMTPLWLVWFIPKAHLAKGSGLLILSVLIQLYAVQVVVSGSQTIPLEWAISLALGGAALLAPTAWYLLLGFGSSLHQQMLHSITPPPPPGGTKPPEWLKQEGTKTIPRKSPKN